MNEKKVLEACFMLATYLLWEKDTVPIEKLSEHIAELNELTDKYFEIAKENYFKVERIEDGDIILVGAINYLANQAIPPLRGDYAWFSISLGSILEICSPNVRCDVEHVPFLLSMQKGIINSMSDALAGEK